MLSNINGMFVDQIGKPHSTGLAFGEKVYMKVGACD